VRAVAPDLAKIAVAPVQVALPIPAAPAPPAPRPAPAAPVTPPDFSAGQLANPGPSYPYLSRKAREEGVVTLRVLVSAEGRAKQLSVERSSGFERLDEEALKTVRRWRFLPARRAGEAVEAWVLVPVTFALG
jgi:protein TonB